MRCYAKPANFVYSFTSFCVPGSCSGAVLLSTNSWRKAVSYEYEMLTSCSASYYVNAWWYILHCKCGYRCSWVWNVPHFLRRWSHPGYYQAQLWTDVNLHRQRGSQVLFGWKKLTVPVTVLTTEDMSAEAIPLYFRCTLQRLLHKGSYKWGHLLELLIGVLLHGLLRKGGDDKHSGTT